jgi:nitroreductase
MPDTLKAPAISTAPSPPPAPEFGDAVITASSQATLDLLACRRSASAQMLAAPGPDPDQLTALLRLAARAPDHGKLFPWRFILLRDGAKADFAQRLGDLAQSQADPDRALMALGKLTAPPVAVCVVSRIQVGKIPEWEQVLSAGSVCTLLLLAAQAMGFGANWITDWYSYDAGATDLLGLGEGERVAGFIYLGTPVEAPLERVRPDMTALVRDWQA